MTSGKEQVNRVLTRLTGYHLARGGPGTVPPEAQERLAALNARALRAEKRVKVLLERVGRLEERLEKQRVRLEKQRARHEKQRERERKALLRRPKLEPVRPLED